MITEVKIFNVDDFATLFESAYSMNIDITDGHRSTQFPVESGETRSDHVIINAVEIKMDLMLTGELNNAFAAIQQAYDQNQLVGIQTRVKTYQPMLLTSFNHSEIPEMVDALKLSLSFIEWRAIEPEYGELPPKKVAKKNQSSTVNRGKVQTQTTSKQEQQSFLTKIGDNLAKIPKILGY
nr:hypothetical protein [uncultured Moellerella sp.]